MPHFQHVSLLPGVEGEIEGAGSSLGDQQGAGLTRVDFSSWKVVETDVVNNHGATFLYISSRRALMAMWAFNTLSVRPATLNCPSTL